MLTTTAMAPRVARTAAPAWSPLAARSCAVLLAVAALAAGFLVTGHASAAAAISRDGPDLTRLLRAMAGLKLSFAAAAMAGILWRLGSPMRPVWLLAYAASLAAMWSGPGLIWFMVHLKLGALLLHGGLFASLVLLWRDPVVGTRLQAAIDARRSALRSGPPPAIR